MHRQRIFDGIIAHYNLLLSPRLGLIWSKRGCCYYAHALSAFICQKVNFIQRLNTEYRDGEKCLIIKSFPGNTSKTHKRTDSQESKQEPGIEACLAFFIKLSPTLFVSLPILIIECIMFVVVAKKSTRIGHKDQ